MTPLKRYSKVSTNVQKLAFLLWFIIPFIPIALLWDWLSPVGFAQSVIVLLVCVFFYALFLFAEYILFNIFLNKGGKAWK
jgi:hypothetical protein